MKAVFKDIWGTRLFSIEMRIEKYSDTQDFIEEMLHEGAERSLLVEFEPAEAAAKVEVPYV